MALSDVLERDARSDVMLQEQEFYDNAKSLRHSGYCDSYIVILRQRKDSKIFQVGGKLHLLEERPTGQETKN